MKQESEYFSDAWKFFKKYYTVCGNSEAWEVVVQDAVSIIKQYPCEPLCRTLILAVLDELERKLNENDVSSICRDAISRSIKSGFSVEKMVKGLVVLISDTEQENEHILAYFDKRKIPYLRTNSLNYGNYSCMIQKEVGVAEDILFTRDIVIERKASLEKLSTSLTADTEQAFLKAKSDNCKLFLLTENPNGYNAIIKHDYNTSLAPTTFMRTLKAWESHFHCNIQFIAREYSGYYILSTFQNFVKKTFSENFEFLKRQ